MKNYNNRAIAITISFAFITSATALTMSNDQYQSAKGGLAAEFDRSKEACGLLSGNAIELCRAEASRRHKVATAALEANYKPSRDGSYKARIAIADADYMVARRKCNDKAGHVKNLCMKEARAVQIAAKTDANAQEDTSIATRAAEDRAKAARQALREAEERTEARQDPANEKRNTDMQIFREKCELLAHDVKVMCVKESEKRFGRS